MNEFINRESAESDLLACAAFVAEQIGSADGRAASLSDIALRYAAKNELDLAAQLADSIPDPHLRDAALAEIAARCADFDDDEYGLQLVEAINDDGLQQQALQNLALRQAHHQKFATALATAESMNDSSAAIAEIALLNAQSGDFAQTRQMLEQISVPVLRARVLNQIAATQIKENQVADAALSEALVEVENVEFPTEQIELLLAIAARFVEAKQNEKALAILEKARLTADKLERRFRDAALAQTAFLYAQCKDFGQAEKTLKSVVDLQQTATAQTAIALEHFHAGEADLALSTLTEAYQLLKSQSAREVRDSAAKFNLLATIAIRLAQFGKFEHALELALENPDDEARHTALTNIAGLCAAQGKTELARQTVQAIKDDAAKVFALIAVARAEGEQENNSSSIETAVKTLTEAHALTEEVGQLSLRSRALNEIAVGYNDADDKTTARQILSESLKVAALILDRSQQSIVLANIAETFEKLDFQLNDSDLEILNLIVRKNL